MLGTSLSPPQDVASLLPPVAPPGVRPLELSWRDELAHMAGNMLSAWASTHWGPCTDGDSFMFAPAGPLPCCLWGTGVSTCCSSIAARIACSILARVDDTRTQESRASCQRPWRNGQVPIWQCTPRTMQRLHMERLPGSLPMSGAGGSAGPSEMRGS